VTINTVNCTRKVVPDKYELLVKFETQGQPYSFKNRQRIVKNRKTGQTYIIKSPEAKAFEEAFNLQVPSESRNKWGALEIPLCLVTVIYYKNRRSDASIEVVKDMLQKTGVVKDDRYIREQHTLGILDKENPRIEIYLYKIPTLTHLITGEANVSF